ncbi:hypothetical protein ACFL0W_02740 [Nanoarchaeota archaeon]
MKEHQLECMIKQTKEGLKCAYCDAKIEKLETEHVQGIMYKTADCPECHRKLYCKFEFLGSGHDDIQSELEKGIRTWKDTKTKSVRIRDKREQWRKKNPDEFE